MINQNRICCFLSFNEIKFFITKSRKIEIMEIIFFVSFPTSRDAFVIDLNLLAPACPG